MYTFLVLGLVPGTNIQITFSMWLQTVEALILAVLLVVLGRRLIRIGRRGLINNPAIEVTVPSTPLHR